MSTQVQYRRGSNVQVAAFTGALGELVIDTTNKIVVVQDGATVGGFAQVGLTAAQTLTNKTLSAATFTGSSTGSGSISLTGNITGANLVTSGAVQSNGFYSTGSFAGTLGTGVIVDYSGGNGRVTMSTGSGLNFYTGTVVAGNIIASMTSTGALSLGATGTANLTGGNVLVSGVVSATGNITGGNIVTGGAISITGSSTAASYSATGNITGANINGIINTNSILNSGANGTGNIGSATTYFNTVFAKSTSAQYADLAEMYCADADYAPGTVVEFGGDSEVTATAESHSTRVAGIISTNPSYLMNSTIDCKNAVAVALTGRVPCRVVGLISKGDRLVASGLHAGVATALDMSQYQPGCIIGKSLENYNSTEVGVIEVAVGRT